MTRIGLIRSEIREHLGGHDMSLERLKGDEQEDDPHGADRVDEQGDQHRGEGADDRPDVRNELHEAVEGAEEHGEVFTGREDAEQAEDVQRDGRAGAHDEAEQQLAAHVAEHRALDEQREVVLGRAVARRHDPLDELADLIAVDQQVDRQNEDQDEVEPGGDDLA